MSTWRILEGDVIERLKGLEPESVHCVVTSPPYWGLRDYGVDGQIGLEETFDEFLERLVAVFSEVRRVLRSDGVCWVNMGDGYASSGSNGTSKERIELEGGGCSVWSNRDVTKGPKTAINGLKPKDLIGQPWRLAFALQSDGWWLRSDCIWHKPNPMPESVTDRPTKAHEYVFLLTKSARYWYDADAVREESERDGKIETFDRPCREARAFGNPSGSELHADRIHIVSGRNLRTVWTIPTQPFPEAHFATFPEKLVEPCIKAGCPEDGTVLDPFSGSGTTGVVALRLHRSYIGIELNPKYAEMSRRRIRDDMPLFNVQAEAECPQPSAST